MSKSLNLVQLIGNLGRDVEMRYTQSGTAVANFSIATAHSRKVDNEWTEETDWHSVTVFGKQAEIAGEFLGKGSKVYIQGRLHTRSWEQDGQKKYKTEVIAENLIFMDKKGAAAPESNSIDDSAVPF